MPEFDVSWREIHVATVRVNAANAREAIAKVRSNDPGVVDEVYASGYQLEFSEEVTDSYTAEEHVEITFE